MTARCHRARSIALTKFILIATTTTRAWHQGCFPPAVEEGMVVTQQHDVSWTIRSFINTRSMSQPLAISDPELTLDTSVNPLRSLAPLVCDSPARPGLVSVVIPTFNRAAIVGRAIESALAQSYRDIEVIVVDDGSTDGTREVVARYGSRVRYSFQTNAGVSAARNTAMRMATGEFVAFLDSDDVWKPWRVEAQVAALAQHPQVGLAWTDMTAVDDRGTVIDERHLRVMYAAHNRVDVDVRMRQVGTLGSLSANVPAELQGASVRIGTLFSEILLGNLLHTSTVLVRRAWIERVGGFDPTFARAGEDYEFYVRLCSVGPVAFIDAPSILYCVGAPDQLTRPSMLLEIARNNLRAIKKWLPYAKSHVRLPAAATRARFADSYAWLAEAELDAGNRLAAARNAILSLMRKPRMDHRALLFMRCALPGVLTNLLRAMRAQIASRTS